MINKFTFCFILGTYECDCPPEWNGLRCDVYDSTFGGGIVDITPQDNIQKSLEEEKKMCLANSCEMKARNNICDEECNSYACNFDGGDCSLGKIFIISSYLDWLHSKESIIAKPILF